MEGNFKPYTQDQLFLFPKSLRDFIPKGHLVYLINDIVEKFDLSPISQKYSNSKNGCRAYAPVMLTKILFYAYCTGVYSSRKIAQRLEENVFFMYLSAMQRPDFRTISDFRKNHLKELSALFVHILKLCQELKMIKLGHISLDGSKVKANASKHKAMSYGRMKKKKDELEHEVQELLKRASEIDGKEDAEYGDKRGDEIPKELRFKEGRLRKIKSAMQRLEKEAKEEGKSEVPDKKQISFTDSESKIMKTHHGFEYSYNGQCAVDEANQVIVAEDVSNSVSDSEQFIPMMEQVKENMGREPEKVSVDSGYSSPDNLEYVNKGEIDGYIAQGNEKKINNTDECEFKKSDFRYDQDKDIFICPAGKELRRKVRKRDGKPTKQRIYIGTVCGDCKFREQCIKKSKKKYREIVADGSEFLRQEMREKLRSEKGRAVYKRRKVIVEPVFGQMKWDRGFRQFSLRGLEKVKGEFALLCTAHNILKIWSFLRSNSFVESCGHEESQIFWLHNYFWLVCMFYILYILKDRKFCS